jgi:GT2 family glycosyltransferase
MGRNHRVPCILSIIIVAYRSRDELPACLKSIPRVLEGQSVEVVVVDNSLDSDGTASVVRTKFAWVDYVVPQANLGFGRANNLGYRRTGGEYVLFLNPDTEVNASALAHCIGRLAKDPGIGLISPKLVMADGSMDLACRRSVPSFWDGFCRASGLAARFPGRAWAAGYNLTHLPDSGTYDVGMINGAFMLGRRTVLDEVAGAGREVFDERFFMYGDDIDLCIRVGASGRRIVYDGSHSIIHLKGVSVAKEYKAMSSAIFDANRDVYLKHFGTNCVLRCKWRLAFGAWKLAARLRAQFQKRKRVRPQ